MYTKLCSLGGLITIPVVTNRIGFVLAHIIGIAVTCVALLLLVKKPYVEEEETLNDDIDMELNF